MNELIAAFRRLEQGEIPALGLRGGRVCGTPPAGELVFPGAFNPLHGGHRRMAFLAAQRRGVSVHYELSLANVDKRRLDAVEVLARVGQFDRQDTVWITRAATFLEKARLFERTTFVIGADTAVRVGDPRYYDLSAERRDAAIEELETLGCRFLVFGRQLQCCFSVLEDLELPPSLRSLCEGISEDDFVRTFRPPTCVAVGRKVAAPLNRRQARRRFAPFSRQKIRILATSALALPGRRN